MVRMNGSSSGSTERACAFLRARYMVAGWRGTSTAVECKQPRRRMLTRARQPTSSHFACCTWSTQVQATQHPCATPHPHIQATDTQSQALTNEDSTERQHSAHQAGEHRVHVPRLLGYLPWDLVRPHRVLRSRLLEPKVAAHKHQRHRHTEPQEADGDQRAEGHGTAALLAPHQQVEDEEHCEDDAGEHEGCADGHRLPLVATEGLVQTRCSGRTVAHTCWTTHSMFAPMPGDPLHQGT